MKKIAGLLIAPILAASLYADANHDAITGFLKNSIAKEALKYPEKKVLIRDIRFLNSKKLDKEWTGYYVTAKLDVTENGEREIAPYQSVLFTNGKVVTWQLATPLAEDIAADLTPKVPSVMYDSRHLIAGSAKAKHKIVVFSDPLCPACQHWVPKVIEKVKNNPSRFALYYYHFPLEQLHPESPGIVKGMIALQRSGKKGVVERVYRGGVENEIDLEKMYGGYRVTKKDIEHYKSDLEWAEKLAVRGTPSLYLDGELDVGGKNFWKM